MADAGTPGEPVARGARGLRLVFETHALWVATATEGVGGPEDRLAATRAAGSRLRTDPDRVIAALTTAGYRVIAMDCPGGMGRAGSREVRATTGWRWSGTSSVFSTT